jgi:ABC-type multidrug transport system permease subunit
VNGLHNHPLYHLVLVRLREFTREPGAIFWVFAFPILISVALGLAFRNQGPTRVDIGVVEGPTAQSLERMIRQSSALTASVMPEAEARKALQSARLGAVVMDPPLRVLSDDTQQNTSLVVAVLRDVLKRTPGAGAPMTMIEEKVQSVGTRYIDFLLPGVLGMSIMSSSIWGVGWSLVQLRTRKLLKRLAATPMKKRDLLLSFVAYRLILAVAETAALVVFGVVAFDLVLRGSLGAVAVVLLAGVLSFSGLAVLAASRAQNAETASGIMNLITMPMFILSGVFFSAERFPEWMQPLVRALPLTALNDALRAVINEGATLMSQAIPMAVMAAWAVGAFFIALRVFRWT